MHIRPAKAEDACAACSVIRRSITELCHADHSGDEVFLGKWLSNKTVENVTRWIRQSHVVVAEEAGTSLGVAAMTDTGKITLNYVSPHARFQGVSKALMQWLEARARTLSLTECVLEATQTALPFYESLGYVKSGQTYLLPLTGSPATVLRSTFIFPAGREHFTVTSRALSRADVM